MGLEDLCIHRGLNLSETQTRRVQLAQLQTRCYQSSLSSNANLRPLVQNHVCSSESFIYVLSHNPGNHNNYIENYSTSGERVSGRHE